MHTPDVIMKYFCKNCNEEIEEKRSLPAYYCYVCGSKHIVFPEDNVPCCNKPEKEKCNECQELNPIY